MATRHSYRPCFLRAWRDAVGVTQAEMAEAIGCSKVHLSNVERGERQYTQQFLEAATQYLCRWYPDLTVADLVLLDPRDASGITLTYLARNVPESQRATAIALLRALTDGAPPGRLGPARSPSAPTIERQRRTFNR